MALCAASVAGWDTHHAATEQLVTEFERWTKPDTGVIKAMLSF